MTPSRRLLLLALETDAVAERIDGGWITRCLHCRSRLRLDEPFASHTAGSVEHIVPRSWFGQTAACHLVEALNGPNDPRNLAVACVRCNNAKGMGPDARGPADPQAFEIIRNLASARLARFRPPDGE